MIQANELRIGNWINVSVDSDGTELPYVVETIFSHGSVVVEGWGAVNNEEYLFGIPLAPEILKKVGFEHVGAYIYRTITREMDFQFRITNVGDGYMPSDCLCNRKIQYVHQLQNLYFALCGQELQIQL